MLNQEGLDIPLYTPEKPYLVMCNLIERLRNGGSRLVWRCRLRCTLTLIRLYMNEI